MTNEHPNLKEIGYKVEIIETNEEGTPLQHIQDIIVELQSLNDDISYPENLKTNRRIKIVFAKFFKKTNKI